MVAEAAAKAEEEMLMDVAVASVEEEARAATWAFEVFGGRVMPLTANQVALEARRRVCEEEARQESAAVARRVAEKVTRQEVARLRREVEVRRVSVAAARGMGVLTGEREMRGDGDAGCACVTVAVKARSSGGSILDALGDASLNADDTGVNAAVTMRGGGGGSRGGSKTDGTGGGSGGGSSQREVQVRETTAPAARVATVAGAM